jgi:hypothetical protein
VQPPPPPEVTTTLNEQNAVSLQASIASNPTTVVPILNAEPLPVPEPFAVVAPLKK